MPSFLGVEKATKFSSWLEMYRNAEQHFNTTQRTKLVRSEEDIGNSYQGDG